MTTETDKKRKAEAGQLVAKTLGKAFNRRAFAGLLGEMLKTAKAEKAFKPMSGAYIQAPYRGFVSQYERVGQYTDPDGEIIDLLVVRLTRLNAMVRARSALRGFVAHYLKSRSGDKSAALVAFHVRGETAWRFSFVRMRHDLVVADGKVSARRKFTPARRYSFLVGTEEKTRTAQAQLAKLIVADTPPALADLEKAFSVEPVTREFFREYRQLYTRVRDAVKADLKVNKKAAADFEKKGINPADFAKKLLGQIVFLYFLQKKKWLGVPLGEKWGQGPAEFLRLQFEARNGGNFHAQFLQPLFYKALRERRWPDDNYKPLNSRIPFLNGGLFTPPQNHDWEKSGVNLPDELFSNGEKRGDDEGTGILDVFDRYNFTVAEDEPAEREVAVDPEMLGKVFENLIGENERKGIGAFYTPRDTVHFMCRESLRQHLVDALQKSGKAPPAAELDEFIRMADLAAENEARRAKAGKAADTAYALPDSVRNIALELDLLLRQVRVCDPAVGSGAFVVGMMHEIVRLRAALAPVVQNRETPYDMKFAAIAESLHGADIDGGAVDIAQLRLWLSLVVDEESPDNIRPLPNLDYKLVRGDSLDRIDRDVLNNPVFARMEKLTREFLAESRPQEKAALGKEVDGILRDLTGDGRRFDLSVAFPGPFRENGGFDIVVGNPPYVRQESIPGPVKRRLLKKYPQGATGSSDLFVYFYLRGLQILRGGGIHAFICSNAWLDVAYGAALQEHLLDSADIIAVYHNEAEKEIKTADINTIVSVIRNCSPNPKSPVQFVTFRAPLEKAADNPDLRREIVRTRWQLKIAGYRGKKYAGDKWGGKFLRAPDIYHATVKKCRDRLIRLGGVAQARRGITSGATEFFYVKSDAVSEWGLEKRFLRPLIKTPGECKGFAIVPGELRRRMFMCRGDKKALKGTNALRYINWGEEMEYNSRPTCKARAPRWWELEERKYSEILVPKGTNDIFRAFLNGAAYSGDRLYEVVPHCDVPAVNLAVALNCSISTLFAEVGARTGLGGGLLDMMLYELEDLPVVDPRMLDECRLPNRPLLPLEDELATPDRQEMDGVVFDALGLTSGEREGILEATVEMVRKRLLKVQADSDNEDDESDIDPDED